MRFWGLCSFSNTIFRIFQVQKGTLVPFSHLFPRKKHFSPSAHQPRCDGTPSTMWSPCWACCWAFPRWSSPSGASRWTKTVAALMIKAEKGEKRRHFWLGDGTLCIYIYICIRVDRYVSFSQFYFLKVVLSEQY